MQAFMKTMTEYFASVPDRVQGKKLTVWALFLAATVFLLFGVAKSRFDMTIEGMFEDDDPTIVAFDWFHHDFGSEDNLFIVYRPKDGDVFSAKSLALLQNLQDELLDSSTLSPEARVARRHIVKITSVVNAPVLIARDDVLISRKLIGDSIPATAEDEAEVRRIALSQPQFPLLYFSRDGEYGGIYIETDFGAIPENDISGDIDALTIGDEGLFVDAGASGAGGEPVQARPRFKRTDMTDYVALMAEVRAVLNKPKYAEHFTYYPVGNTAVTEYDLKVVEEMGLLNLAGLVIIALLLWYLFRSLSAVVWPITIVVLSVLWAIGIAGWTGLPMSSLVMITVMLTLAVGIADAVHILSAYLFYTNSGSDHRSALRQAYRKTGTACLLTTLTTMLAMLIVSLMPMVPMKIFGFMCAAGVALAFFFTLYVLPLMLDLWAPRPKGKRACGQLNTAMGRFFPNFARGLAQLLDKVMPFVQKRPYTIFVTFLAFFILCLYGATLTTVDTNPLGAYPKDSEVRRNFSVVDARMMGTQSMEVYLDLGQENAFLDPFVLNIVDELQRSFERKYRELVKRTASLTDVIKQSYKVLNQGREDMYVIPDTQNRVAQTLWMFNSATPEDRRKLVSDLYDRSHISIQLRNEGSRRYNEVFNEMRRDIDAAVQRIKQRYPQTEVALTGMLVLMMQGAEYISNTQLQSFVWALVLISGLLLVVFGSLKAGAIAIVPNLIPATMAYGLLGLLNIPLDFTTIMIAPVIIGIAVDDTIHFMTRYQSEYVVDGDIARALTATIKETGQAIVLTALVLGLGFGILALSDSAGTANLGRFGALAILAGLINDLFLLPAMIIIFHLRFQPQEARAALLQ